MLIDDNITSSDTLNSSSFYEFVGFAKDTTYIYAIYVTKYGYRKIFSNNIYHSFKTLSKGSLYTPYL
jgi:hypothetical protein